ncbi:MAG TPA: hypothetical protein DER01_05145 [Phycisphaerales bacterium]|nr:hypothetical protein [Phycisphaerales bacterium]
MTEQTPISSTNAHRPHKTIRQRLCMLLILWLACIPLTFAVTYTIGWYHFRNSAALQGTLQKFTYHPMSKIIKKLDSYHEKYGQYPESIRYLIADAEPIASIAEDQFQYLDQQTMDLMKDNVNEHIFYAKTKEGYTLSSYGLDNKKGGIGLDVDILVTQDTYLSFITDISDHIHPTFKQFVFDMTGSWQIFKVAAWMNLLLCIAIFLECARSSFKIQLIFLVINFLILLPFTSLVALTLTALHLAAPYSTH